MRRATKIPAVFKTLGRAHRGEERVLGDSLRSRERQRIRRGEGCVVGGERTSVFGGVRVQTPLVQVAAALAALVDAGEDAVVGKVK